jgi:hypothetical protein
LPIKSFFVAAKYRAEDSEIEGEKLKHSYTLNWETATPE